MVQILSDNQLSVLYSSDGSGKRIENSGSNSQSVPLEFLIQMNIEVGTLRCDPFKETKLC